MTAYKNKYISLLLAVFIAAGTLLPFFASYTHTNAGLAQQKELFGDKVLICTGDGFAWVKWEDLQNGKAPVKQQKNFHCPLCYIAANPFLGMALLAVASLCLLRRDLALLVFSFSNVSAPVRLAWAISRPRAPPFPS